MDVDKVKLRKYLLGELSGDDLVAIDLRIIEDEDFSAEVSLAETELVEDFLENSLERAEIVAFQANFLCSPERKALLKEIAGLRKFAMGPAAGNERSQEHSIGLLPGRSFLALMFRPLVVAPVAFGLILIAFLAWQFFSPSPLTPLEIEYAQLNSRDFSNPGSDANSAVSLMPVNFRDGGSLATRRARDLPEQVFFRLGLPAGEKPGSHYDLRVFHGTGRIFSINSIISYANQGGTELRVLIPRSILTSAEYQLRVDGPTLRSPAIYPLIIE